MKLLIGITMLSGSLLGGYWGIEVCKENSFLSWWCGAITAYFNVICVAFGVAFVRNE